MYLNPQHWMERIVTCRDLFFWGGGGVGQCCVLGCSRIRVSFSDPVQHTSRMRIHQPDQLPYSLPTGIRAGIFANLRFRNAMSVDSFLDNRKPENVVTLSWQYCRVPSSANRYRYTLKYELFPSVYKF